MLKKHYTTWGEGQIIGSPFILGKAHFLSRDHPYILDLYDTDKMLPQMS